MIGYLEQYLSKVDKQYKGNKKPITVDLDVVGFSRGATSARMFVSKVERLISGTDKTYTAYRQNGRIGKDWINTPWKYNQAWLTSSCGLKVNFNFMGLWDTVPAYGEDTSNDVAEMKALNMSLSIPDKFKKWFMLWLSTSTVLSFTVIRYLTRQVKQLIQINEQNSVS